MPIQSSAHWQNTLNPQLMQRLMRPIVQPGVIGSALADQIRSRSERWSTRLPLLTQITQRHRLSEAATGQPPIVYAQPAERSVERTVETNKAAGIAVSSPSVTPSRPTVIQAKFAPSASNPSAHPVLPKVPSLSLLVNSTRSQNPTSFPNPTNYQNSTDHQDLTTLNDSSQRSPNPSHSSSTDRPIVQVRSPVPLTEASSQQNVPQLPIVSVIPSPRPQTATRAGQIVVVPRWFTRRQQETPFNAAESFVQMDAVPSGLSNSEMADSRTADPRTIEPENGRSPLPVIRSVAPVQRLPETPLVFAQSGVTGAAVTSYPSPSGSTHPATPPSITRTIAAQNPMVQNPMPTRDTGHNAIPPSITREVNAALKSPSSPPSSLPQTIVSRTEPPPLDVDALVDKVERKLARRMAIERERRGWKSC